MGLGFIMGGRALAVGRCFDEVPANTRLTYEYDTFTGRLLWNQSIRQARRRVI